MARLIDFLSKLEHGKTSCMVDLLTVQEMADMLGVTPESVSRVLAEFKRNNILRQLADHPISHYEIDSRGLQHEAVQ